MDHMPAPGQSGFDLYVGKPGEQHYCQTSRSLADATDYTVTLFSGTKTKRNFTLNFPLYNDVTSVEIGVAAGSSVSALPPFREEGVIVVYGTSITQGGCASRPGMAYSNILSRKLNTEFVNLGFSGNGRGEPALANLINQNENKKMVVLDYEANAGAGKKVRSRHSSTSCGPRIRTSPFWLFQKFVARNTSTTQIVLGQPES